ncbi:MAG: hypothetical protein QXD88_02315 [Candidatus Anstonellales archaeon]
MLVGDVINQIVAVVKERNDVPFPSYNFRVIDIKELEGGVVAIQYESVFDYGNAGKIVIVGEIYDRVDEEKFKRTDILNSWRDFKKLPNEYLSFIMTYANWISTVHATVICQSIRFRPPVLPISFKMASDQQK